jgi:DNA-binding XRE family transcriptional regulator
MERDSQSNRRLELPRLEIALDAARLAEKLKGDWTRLRINQQLRLVRRQRAMSQAELGRLAGYSQPEISHIETCRRDPPWDVYQRLFLALDCVPIVLPKPVNLWPHQYRLWRDPKAGQPAEDGLY